MEKMMWWDGSMRVMQYNLQVADTPGMDPVKIASETEELACNVVVMNVGGIYAWYPTAVKYHHINEFLPKGRDLLEELIQEFHKRNIKFVARFDFSITDDTTYLQKPHWFARKRDKTPYFRGEKRMGNWSLFLNTCANSGYRNEEVAVPVIREVLKRYDIDGIFFNAPTASPCFCEKCQEKYRKFYGVDMPEAETDFAPDWLSRCTKDNIGVIYKAIKEAREEVPMILYYIPYSWDFLGMGRIERDNIYERYATADLICTESQDVLSRGVHGGIPETVNTTLAMKAGRRSDEALRPFGIIHSCPGMDWRHVGLPDAEYLPWMCQVPASGGIIWHSVTGYPDTITDKRILRTISQVDHRIMKSEPDMKGAKSKAETVLFWDGSPAAIIWADALMKNHMNYDLMQDYAVEQKELNRYRMAVVPLELFKKPDIRAALEMYVKQGGTALVENIDAESSVASAEFLGIQKSVSTSEYLRASYLRFEKAGDRLKKNMDTDKIAFRGTVLYCQPTEESEVLATLVPPFAPVEVTGAPPERASMPVSHTDIPLALRTYKDAGEVIYLPFALSALLKEFKLADHYQLVGNLMDILLKRRELEAKVPSGVQITMFESEKKYIIHLVNETGERPLRENIPVHNLCLNIKVPDGDEIKNVRAVIEEQSFSWQQEEDRIKIELDRLDVWEMVVIDF